MSSVVTRRSSGEARTFWQNGSLILPIAVIHSLIYRQLTYWSLYPPWVLEPTWIDRQIPFLVWTVWPYLAMVVICFAPLLIRCPVVFRFTLIAYLCASGLALASYLLVPTAIVRTDLEDEPGGISWWVYRQFVEGLGPGACCPSGHIIFPALGCYAMCLDGRKGWRALAVFTAASSLTILTLKEHVAWDWLGGGLVVILAILIAQKLCPVALPSVAAGTPSSQR